MENVKTAVEDIRDELIEFARQLVAIPSVTGNEEKAAMCSYQKMVDLGYDEVLIDDFGNVLGRMGNGPTKILMDAHLDVVGEGDYSSWEHDPFGGVIKDGILHGRGSVDTKSAAAALVYAGMLAKHLGLLDGKTIYVSTSIMEEDYDDALLDSLIKGQSLKLDYAVIGEPSNLRVARGHRGRAMFVVSMQGISAHGSMPQTGENAVYKMAEIINRVKALQDKLSTSGSEPGSVALTKIESRSASLNAVPDLCDIYLDRRLALGEDEAVLTNEMDELVQGTGATWRIYDARGTSWKGLDVLLHTFLPAWETDVDHPLTRAAVQSYEELMSNPAPICKWDFATTAFATAAKRGIPTIGFGPGDIKLAHKVNEQCPVDEIAVACMFFTNLLSKL